MTSPGLSARAWLTSVTSPVKGEYSSLAAFTLSRAPNSSTRKRTHTMHGCAITCADANDISVRFEIGAFHSHHKGNADELLCALIECKFKKKKKQPISKHLLVILYPTGRVLCQHQGDHSRPHHPKPPGGMKQTSQQPSDHTLSICLCGGNLSVEGFIKI